MAKNELEMQPPPAAALNNPKREAAIAQMIRLDCIFPDPHNPRDAMDHNALANLADSIRQHGMKDPITVRLIPSNLPAGVDHYRCIDGHRRLKAAEMADLYLVPARVMAVDNDRDAAVIALVSFLQREDLKPLELSNALARLVDLGFTQEEVADKLGIKPNTVSKTLALRRLPDEVKTLMEQGVLSRAHAIPLCSLTDSPEKVIELAERAIGEGWTSKRMESAVSLIKHPPREDAPAEAKPAPATISMDLDAPAAPLQHVEPGPVAAAQALPASDGPTEAEINARLDAAYDDEQEHEAAGGSSARNIDDTDEETDDAQPEQAGQGEVLGQAVDAAGAVNPADDDSDPADSDDGAGATSPAGDVGQPVGGAAPAVASTPSVPVQQPVPKVTPAAPSKPSTPAAPKATPGTAAAIMPSAPGGYVQAMVAEDDFAWLQDRYLWPLSAIRAEILRLEAIEFDAPPQTAQSAGVAMALVSGAATELSLINSTSTGVLTPAETDVLMELFPDRAETTAQMIIATILTTRLRSVQNGA